MKKSVHTLVIITAWLLLTTACSSKQIIKIYISASPTWVATQDAQQEYSKALERWHSHHLSNYEIIVNIYSSISTPCSAKATLKVQNNRLLTVTELETPIPIPLPDKSVIFNPECHNYENYLIEKQFEVVEDLLTGKFSNENWNVNWNVKFDAEYGYITELAYVVTGSEATRVVNYSNFTQK
jgi:hypothetical protein